jgi:hypothetical protein
MTLLPLFQSPGSGHFFLNSPLPKIQNQQSSIVYRQSTALRRDPRRCPACLLFTQHRYSAGLRGVPASPSAGSHHSSPPNGRCRRTARRGPHTTRFHLPASRCGRQNPDHRSPFGARQAVVLQELRSGFLRDKLCGSGLSWPGSGAWGTGFVLHFPGCGLADFMGK